MIKAVHHLGAACITHDGMTACGLIAASKVSDGEYGVMSKNGTIGPIKTVRETWDGVTCKSCLRNPHAPGNRFAKNKPK